MCIAALAAKALNHTFESIEIINFEHFVPHRSHRLPQGINSKVISSLKCELSSCSHGFVKTMCKILFMWSMSGYKQDA